MIDNVRVQCRVHTKQLCTACTQKLDVRTNMSVQERRDDINKLISWSILKTVNVLQCSCSVKIATQDTRPTQCYAAPYDKGVTMWQLQWDTQLRQAQQEMHAAHSDIISNSRTVEQSNDQCTHILKFAVQLRAPSCVPVYRLHIGQISGAHTFIQSFKYRLPLCKPFDIQLAWEWPPHAYGLWLHILHAHSSNDI